MRKLPALPKPSAELDVLTKQAIVVLSDELRLQRDLAQPPYLQSETEKERLDELIQELARQAAESQKPGAVIGLHLANPFLREVRGYSGLLPRRGLKRRRRQLEAYLFAELSDWFDEEYHGPRGKLDPDHPSQSRRWLRMLKDR